LGEILIERELLTKKDLFRALAIQHKIPFLDIENLRVDREIIEKIPKELAHKHRLVPIAQKNGVMLVAVSDPGHEYPKDELSSFAGKCEVHWVLVSPEDLDIAIERYYGPK